LSFIEESVLAISGEPSLSTRMKKALTWTSISARFLAAVESLPVTSAATPCTA